MYHKLIKNDKSDDAVNKEIDARVEKGIQDLFNRWLRWSCKTSALAMLGFCMFTGKWAASHYDRIMRAIGVLMGGD